MLLKSSPNTKKELPLEERLALIFTVKIIIFRIDPHVAALLIFWMNRSMVNKVENAVRNVIHCRKPNQDSEN